jgi:hypothetical protein
MYHKAGLATCSIGIKLTAVLAIYPSLIMGDEISIARKNIIALQLGLHACNRVDSNVIIESGEHVCLQVL